jgi:hypothetical protein
LSLELASESKPTWKVSLVINLVAQTSSFLSGTRYLRLWWGNKLQIISFTVYAYLAFKR